MKETELAAILKTDCKRLAIERRTMTVGEHFQFMDGFVVYTAQGLAKMKERLGITDEGWNAALGPGQPDPWEGKRPTPEKTAVVYKFTMNPHLLLARIDGINVRVRVRSTENFIVGMEIPVIFEQGDVYALTRHCPRWRGRW